MQTVRHYFGWINSSLDTLSDARHQPFVYYPPRFLTWWAASMYLFKLGSRRQLDYALRDFETHVLDNINRLANTSVESLPVHDTMVHFLKGCDPDEFGELRTQMLASVIRMRVLDRWRLDGKLVVAVDGTGHLSFARRHCDRCLTQKHDTGTRYLHNVLEAKVVAGDLALSAESEFIENPPGLSVDDYRQVKQDCELKAFHRMAPRLKQAHPRTPLCLVGDALYASGQVISTCEQNDWSYILTLKPKDMSAVWQDATSLLELCPQNKLIVKLPDDTCRQYRWVPDVSYIDSYNHEHTFTVIFLQETAQGKTTSYSWLTDLSVSTNTVDAIVTNGARKRWNIENQGFNVQKNSGLNLEHAYSHHPDVLKSLYPLLQIAHIILQLLERGSLLKAIARDAATTVQALYGSLRNIAACLLEAFRCHRIPDEAFDAEAAQRIQIRFDSS